MHLELNKIDAQSKMWYGMAKDSSGLSTIAESKAYQAAITTAEDAIKTDNVETAILIDKKGKVLFVESQGDAGSVVFNTEQCKQMKDATLTHNHPMGSTFSDADIATLVENDLLAMRATSKNQTYQLSRANGSFPKKGDFVTDFQKAFQQHKAITDAEYEKFKHLQYGNHSDIAKYQEKCDALNKQLDQLQHEWLKKNSKTYGYRYSVFK